MSDMISQADGGRAGWRRSTRGCPRSASARTRRSRARPSGCVSSPPSAGCCCRRISCSRTRGSPARRFSVRRLSGCATAPRRARSRCCSATRRIGSRAATPTRCCCSKSSLASGVEVCFAKEPERGASPEDELLRQFQGMIAEYERAQIRERTRRGKLHRARTGHQAVLSCAPYGYRYVKKDRAQRGFLGDRRGPGRGRARGVRALHQRRHLDRRARPLADRARHPDARPARRCGTARRCGRCCATPPTAGRPRSARPRRSSATASRRAPPAPAASATAAAPRERTSPPRSGR